VLDLELLEKIYVSIFEGLFGVMLFLIQNVVVDIADLRVAVRKCSIAFLPAELSFDPCMVVDEITGIILDISHKIRQCHRRFQTNKRMRMVRNAIDDDGLLSLVLDDPRHIFEHFIPLFFLEEVLSSLYGKNNLNVNLRKCACHVSPPKNESCHPFGIYFENASNAKIITSLRDCMALIPKNPEGMKG